MRKHIFMTTRNTSYFILFFVLILVLGLSSISIITQGFLNDYYPAITIIGMYTTINIGLWLWLARTTRVQWTRIGAIFGTLWSLSLCAMHWLSNQSSEFAAVQAHIYLLSSCIALATFSCLALGKTTQAFWHTWTPRISFITLLTSLIVGTILWQLQLISFVTFEYSLAITMLVLSLFIWWVRKETWIKSPALTILLSLIVGCWYFLTIPNTHREYMFLFSQVSQLFLLLTLITMLYIQHQPAKLHFDYTIHRKN